MQKLKFITFLTLAIFALACNKDEAPNVPIEPIAPFTYTDSPFDLQGIDAKFVKDLAYDSKERTQLDVWLPTSSSSTGLVIYVHGGGFTSGDKDFVYAVQAGGAWDFPSDVRYFLRNNIAFASIRYTYLNNTGETEGVKKPMNDVKRALQYIRSRANDFNIDKSKIILAGNSAGAGTALWIALNNDFALPSSSDPVLRESSRVRGVVARETQASYDIENRWVNQVFADYGISWAQILSNETGNIQKIYGVSSVAQYQSSAITAYRAEVDMLGLLTADDPEIWVNNTLRDVVNPYVPYNADIPSHHAFHARELKRRADSVGVENVVYYGKNPVIYADPSNESWTQFCKRKINE